MQKSLEQLSHHALTQDLQKQTQESQKLIISIVKSQGGTMASDGAIQRKTSPVTLDQSKNQAAALYKAMGQRVRALSEIIDYHDLRCAETLDTLFEAEAQMQQLLTPEVLTPAKVSLLEKECSGPNGFLTKGSNAYGLSVSLDKLFIQFIHAIPDLAQQLQLQTNNWSLAESVQHNEQLRGALQALAEFLKKHGSSYMVRSNNNDILRAELLLKETHKIITQRVDDLSSFGIIKENMLKLKNLTDNISIELKQLDRMRNDPGQQPDYMKVRQSLALSQQHAQMLLSDITTKYLEFPEHKQRALHDKNLFLRLTQIKEVFELDLDEMDSMDDIQSELADLLR